MTLAMVIVVLLGFLFMLFGVRHSGDETAILSALAGAALLAMLFLMAEAVRVLGLVRLKLAKETKGQ